jgi:hypothetical protein
MNNALFVGKSTDEDIPSEIYWCNQCHTPIFQLINQMDKGNLSVFAA